MPIYNQYIVSCKDCMYSYTDKGFDFMLRWIWPIFTCTYTIQPDAQVINKEHNINAECNCQISILGNIACACVLYDIVVAWQLRIKILAGCCPCTGWVNVYGVATIHESCIIMYNWWISMYAYMHGQEHMYSWCCWPLQKSWHLSAIHSKMMCHITH